jgi:hypothetical protein
VWNGPLSIMNSAFANNASNSNGADGGVILDSIVRADQPTPTAVVTVSNSVFANNSSMNGDGGAISTNAIVAANVIFSNNQTVNGLGGGAIELHNGNDPNPLPPSRIVNATFDGNRAGAARDMEEQSNSSTDRSLC